MTEGMEPAPSTALTVPQAKGVMAVGEIGSMPAPRYALQVPTQTRAIGIIQPPPEIRVIAVRSRILLQQRIPSSHMFLDGHSRHFHMPQDKTAEFVGRNGPEFAKKCAPPPPPPFHPFRAPGLMVLACTGFWRTRGATSNLVFSLKALRTMPTTCTRRAPLIILLN